MTRPSHRPERRRARLVDTPTQRRVLLTVGKALAGHLLLLGALVSLIAPAALIAGNHLRTEALSEAASVLLAALAIPALCCFLGLYAHALLHAGRIVGPCYRFQKVAEDLRALRIPRGLRIRRDDHLQDTAAALDRGITAVHDGIARVQAEAHAAAQLLASDEAPLDPRARSELKQRIEGLLQATAAFELSGPAPEGAAVETPEVSSIPVPVPVPVPVESL